MGAILDRARSWLRAFETDGVPASGLNEPDKGEGIDLFEVIEEEMEGFVAGDSVTRKTWAQLSAITGAREGQRGEVTGADAGTHTDPVVGGTVANIGVYAWDTSPAGWERLADNLGQRVDGAEDDIAALEAVLPFAADGRHALAPGLGATSLLTGINRGIMFATGADGLAHTPLAFPGYVEGFCHALDAYSVQQIYAKEYGLLPIQLTFGPGNKTIVGRHGTDSVLFTRTLGVNQLHENPIGIAKRRAAPLATPPFTAPLVRIAITYGESLNFGLSVTTATLVNVNAPLPGYLKMLNGGIYPSGASTGTAVPGGNITSLVDAASTITGANGEAPGLSFGVGVALTHGLDGPTIIIGSGQGGTKLADMSAGDIAFTNLQSMVSAARTLALAAWPGCTVEVSVCHLIMGANDNITSDTQYATDLDTFFDDFDAAMIAITSQAAPPLHIVGQSRRNLTLVGSVRRGAKGTLDYALAHTECLWRCPGYADHNQDSTSHKEPWDYIRLGSDGALAYKRWIREGRRLIPRITAALRTGTSVSVTFGDMDEPISLDPRIIHYPTLGLIQEDGGVDAETAVVTSAVIDGDFHVTATLDQAPTGVGKNIGVAALAETFDVVPSPTAGLRTPIMSMTDDVCPFTGEVRPLRPAIQVFPSL